MVPLTREAVGESEVITGAAVSAFVVTFSWLEYVPLLALKSIAATRKVYSVSGRRFAT